MSILGASANTVNKYLHTFDINDNFWPRCDPRNMKIFGETLETAKRLLEVTNFLLCLFITLITPVAPLVISTDGFENFCAQGRGRFMLNFLKS